MQYTKQDKYQSPVQILDTLTKDLSQRTSTPAMPIGIRELDDLVWGLHKGELLIIGARPSHGKTSLSLQIAWNLAKQNIPTIFVSLEMSRTNILERIFCNEFNVHGWKLRKGFDSEVKLFNDNQLKFRARLEKAPFQIIDHLGRNIQEIEALIKEFKPEAIFIDHAQKISSRGYSSKYEALSDYAHRLQDLAIEHNCAIVLNSQYQRGGEFLKGSGDLEECADTLLRCCWPQKDKPGKHEPTDYEVSVEKQKHGPCDFTVIKFDPSTYQFSSKVNNVLSAELNSTVKKIFNGGIDN